MKKWITREIGYIQNRAVLESQIEHCSKYKHYSLKDEKRNKNLENKLYCIIHHIHIYCGINIK